ncbi:gluconate 5-dehydrogenase [Yersinia similis]|nr:gluconate 5-dehydrogenase [Yersinia similis]
MDVFTASLLSACSLRRGHFVNNLNQPLWLVQITDKP